MDGNDRDAGLEVEHHFHQLESGIYREYVSDTMSRMSYGIAALDGIYAKRFL